VAEQRPSIYVLQVACRRLRQTSTFAPAIAEVLSAVQAAKQRAKRQQAVLDSLPQLQQRLDECEQARPEREAEWAEQRACRRDQLIARYKEYPADWAVRDKCAGLG
jgi:hypothetical protein